MRVKRKGRWVWKRVTVESADRDRRAGSSLHDPRQARPQPREGPVPRDGDARRHGQARRSTSACDARTLPARRPRASATRSPTAAASSSGASRCSRGRCGSRAGSGCRSRRYAVDGARAADVAHEQVPAFARPHRAARTRATTSAASTSASTTCARPTGTRAPSPPTTRPRSPRWPRAATGCCWSRSRSTSAARAPASASSRPTRSSRPAAREHGALVLDLRALRRPQPGDDRPRAPDRVRAGVDRRARARRARRPTGWTCASVRRR